MALLDLISFLFIKAYLFICQYSYEGQKKKLLTVDEVFRVHILNLT